MVEVVALLSYAYLSPSKSRALPPVCLLTTSRQQTGSRVPAAEDNEGGSGGGGDGDADDVEWGVYLRTEEDSDRTKKEWEKEHQGWEDEQVGRGRGRSVIQPAIFSCSLGGFCFGGCFFHLSWAEGRGRRGAL